MPISPKAAVIDTNVLVYSHFQDSQHYGSIKVVWKTGSRQ